MDENTITLEDAIAMHRENEDLQKLSERMSAAAEEVISTDPIAQLYASITKYNDDVAIKEQSKTLQRENLISHTLAERGSRYGAFADHAVIAQDLQDSFRSRSGWTRLAPDMRQALTVMADKIARILNGDPTYIDNWHDIQGYAKLVEDRLVKEQV